MQVPSNLCDASLQPPAEQSCAPEPCPPTWTTGPWSECSESCEKGVQERQVYCAQIIANGLPTVVEESKCSELGAKPSNKQECNAEVICPTWHIGPWKPVSGFRICCSFFVNTKVIDNLFCSVINYAETESSEGTCGVTKKSTTR